MFWLWARRWIGEIFGLTKKLLSALFWILPPPVGWKWGMKPCDISRTLWLIKKSAFYHNCNRTRLLLHQLDLWLIWRIQEDDMAGTKILYLEEKTLKVLSQSVIFRQPEQLIWWLFTTLDQLQLRLKQSVEFKTLEQEQEIHLVIGDSILINKVHRYPGPSIIWKVTS